ncbi:hypothetical protein [Cryptosporangium arvum]|uniref:hypothetical protein n=1 Tax=Cryptosporangium arvum TaxID=80871 RepID=UPI00056428E1|nr:hypothetical protein [Cryptosporangium arvum]
MLDVPLSSLLANELDLSQRAHATRAGYLPDELVAEDFLYLLALRTAISRALSWGSQADVREAIEGGAKWTDVAIARGNTTAEARAEFLHWVNAQAALWDSGPTPTGLRFGLEPEHRRAVRALAERS